MVELFKALGDVNRLRLINLLTSEELCVCEIEVLLDLSQSNASRHLKKLRDQKIILSSKEAQWIHYRMNSRFLEENTELMNFIRSGFEREAIYREDLARLEKYRMNHLSCTDIREDKNQVCHLIR